MVWFQFAKVWIFHGSMHTIKKKSIEGRKCMKVKRGTSEKYKEHPFNPCCPNSPIPSLHSLSIRLLWKHCSLTIFNPFNFIVHEFSVIGKFLEIFRVFESWAKDCISIPCKHIENRPEKDGVLTVGKRRLFSRKRRVSGAKTSSFESKDFVFSRKNAVFFSMVSLLSSEKYDFGRKQARNRRKILPMYPFCFLASLFGK